MEVLYWTLNKHLSETTKLLIVNAINTTLPSLSHFELLLDPHLALKINFKSDFLWWEVQCLCLCLYFHYTNRLSKEKAISLWLESNLLVSLWMRCVSDRRFCHSLRCNGRYQSSIIWLSLNWNVVWIIWIALGNQQSCRGWRPERYVRRH